MARRTARVPYHSGRVAYQAYAAQARLYLDRLGLTWFKPPAGERRLALTATRLSDTYSLPAHVAEPAAAELIAEKGPLPGSYAWAKQAGQAIADGLDVMGKAAGQAAAYEQYIGRIAQSERITPEQARTLAQEFGALHPELPHLDALRKLVGQLERTSHIRWFERELNRPASSLDHRTARFAGKPYHWRQDYTGQLKLAAGESPW